MSEKLLRGEVHIFLAVQSTAATVPPNDVPAAAWDEIGEDLITEDGLALSHTESIEDEMVLNETNAIDDYRVSEEWMLSFSTKDYQAEVLQRVLNGNPITTTAPVSGGVGYQRIPLRKGPAVTKQAIMARIDDTPYRIITVANVDEPIRTQISFLNASQRDGWESNLGPKGQGAMVNFTFKGLIDPGPPPEVGYIDLTNLNALP